MSLREGWSFPIPKESKFSSIETQGVSGIKNSNFLIPKNFYKIDFSSFSSKNFYIRFLRVQSGCPDTSNNFLSTLSNIVLGILDFSFFQVKRKSLILELYQSPGFMNY